MQKPSNHAGSRSVKAGIYTSACGDGCIDVKGKIGIAVKRLEIKGFKTKGSIFECCFWSFFFLSVETCRKAENGRVVATLLI